MTEQTAMGPVKRVQIEAVVIRADGTCDELGVIADSSRWWNLVGRRFADRRIKRANARAQAKKERS